MSLGFTSGPPRVARPAGATSMSWAQTSSGFSYLRVDRDRAGVAQDELLLAPSVVADGAPLVVVHHGLLNDQEIIFDARWDGVRETLLEAGYTIVASSSADDDWGNEAGLDQYLAVHDFARDVFPQLGNTMLIGASMGGCASLSAARRQEMTDVVAWAGISPVCGLQAQYNDVAAHQEHIEPAYPGWSTTGTWDDTVTDGYDPLGDFTGADYTGVAYRFYASPDDTTVDKALHTDPMHTMLDGAGVTSSVQAGTGGHMDASLFQPADLLAFFETYR